MPVELYGPQGQSMTKYLEQKEYAGRPKNPKPIVGDAFSDWGGISRDYLHLPGGGIIQFDTSRLKLSDFRRMSEHYQLSSSLNVLTFMLHQLDWTIVGDDPKVNTWCTYNLELMWTRVVRALSSAFTFGFSANACEWENDTSEGKLRLNKIKDLVPDECEVNWKYVDSTINTPTNIEPKVPIFDGIRRRGTTHKIPVENSLWYPLLMQNGDYYGRKLLRSAFQPWFFSSLIHLYQNKYFERFGEPVPIGRAPYNDSVQVGDKKTYGYELMANLLGSVRSRSAVVLPNSRSKEGLNDQPEYDYTIEYLESQMRGADFEMYLTRLDEEMSLALFTPLLLLRTANAGGFNQGIAHTQVYLWLLNAVAGDWSEYVNKYILRPMAIYNFGVKAKLPRIKFRKLGMAQQETLRAIVQALISKDKVKLDYEELGQQLGMTITEVENVLEPQGGDPFHPEADTGDDRVGRPERPANDDLQPGSTTKAISQRLNEQITRAYKKNTLDEWLPAPGHTRSLCAELQANGHIDARRAATAFTSHIITALTDAAQSGVYPEASDMIEYCNNILKAETDKLYDGLLANA